MTTTRDTITEAVNLTLGARGILVVIDLALAGWGGSSDDLDEDGLRYAVKDACAAVHDKLEQVLDALDELESARVMAMVEPQAAPLACGGRS